MKTPVIGLLLLSLTACGTRPTEGVVVETKTEYVGPPDALLVKPQSPTRRVDLNADLLNDRDAWQSTAQACFAKLDGIAEWKLLTMPDQPTPPS